MPVEATDFSRWEPLSSDLAVEGSLASYIPLDTSLEPLATDQQLQSTMVDPVSWFTDQNFLPDLTTPMIQPASTADYNPVQMSFGNIPQPLPYSSREELQRRLDNLLAQASFIRQELAVAS